MQRSGRRVERLQYRQGGHVDASDGESDGVPTEVVGQGLDLGQFWHGFQCACQARVMRRVSLTISDSAQLTIDSTIAAQIAVHQKSSM